MDVATLPITTLKGVGPKLKDKLEQRLGWRSVQDALFHLPFRYQDRTRLTPLGSLRPGQEALVSVKVELTDGTRTITAHFRRSAPRRGRPGDDPS
jgi:ATP-dependent DNA helicase RecG